MKKSSKFFCGVLIMAMLFLLVGCGGVRVVFDIEDARLISGELKQNYKDGVEIIPPEISKDGYALVGWDGDYKTPSESITVKPIWKKIHAVTFDLAGGTAAEGTAELTQSIIDGESAKAPETTRPGYVFNGWSADFSAVTSDITVTAQWVPTYTVTFDLAGGKQNDTTPLVQTVKQGEAAQAPSVSRDKYNFVKWSADISSVTKNLTVKAVWERKVLDSTEIFDEIRPGTVKVNTYRLNDIYFSSGTGFFISENGTLLTNYHVIENAREIKVTLSSGVTYDVDKIISYDKILDVAVLSVNTKGNKVPYLEISEEAPKVGEVSYTLSNPLGLTDTFSSGNISYVNRTIDEAPGVFFIQTTTPISQGSSGSPLVDKYGLVIGINTASYSEGQNINLAIDISQIEDLQEVNLTTEELFQKEGTLEWYIGEKPVSETASSLTGQLLENGDTVSSTISSDMDQDVYFIETPESDSFMIVMIRSDSMEELSNMYCVPVLSETPDWTASYSVSKEYYDYTFFPGEDEYFYFFIMIYLPPNTADQFNYVGVGFASEDMKIEYEMFILTIPSMTIIDIIT